MEMASSAAGVQIPPEGGVAALTETVPSTPKNATPGPRLDGLKVDTKVAAVRYLKKEIPAKKDRLEPLKIDMTKHFLLPPTSAQLSLQCLECHIIFSDHKSKERHLKQSHPAEYEQCMLGDALFACYVCDRHFTCSTELMAHQRTHTEKQPFKCPICGEAFRRSSELTIHKKVHFGLDGYACSDCGKPCKTLTLLKYHRRTHTGERPYVCKDCGKRFSMSKALQKHLLTHTQEETDGDGSEAVLLTPTGEATHVKKLSGNSQCKPAVTFSCSLCDGIFKTAKTRLQHMKLKHSDHQKAGQPVETHTKICLPAQVLQHVKTFARGQPLQQMETLGQEQMQELISSLGQGQVKDKLEIMGLEHTQEQRETNGEEEAKRQTTGQEWAQGQSEALRLEQAPAAVVLEQTQGQTETLCLELVASDTLVLEQTQGQTETLCLEQRASETLVLEQTKGQTETLCLEERVPETLLLEQTQGQVETIGQQQIQRKNEMLEPKQTQEQGNIEQEQLQVETVEVELNQAQMETVVLEQTKERMDTMHLDQLKSLELGQTHLQVDALEVEQTQSEMETVELELTQVQVETVELELTEVQVDTAELDLTQVQVEPAKLDLTQAELKSTELDMTRVQLETDELKLSQVQLGTTELELEQVKSVELENAEKQMETWEQVESHPQNKSEVESLLQIETEKDIETCQEPEHAQQCPANTPGEKEQSSTQTLKLTPALSLSVLPPEGPEQATCQHEEIQLQTLNLLCLSNQSKNNHVEHFPECQLNPPIPGQEFVQGGQRMQSKKRTAGGKSTKHSLPLEDEREFPGHAQLEKHPAQHWETPSKARRTKSTSSKKEHLIVRFIAPEKGKQPKKQNQPRQIWLKDQGHKLKNMAVSPQLGQKVQVKPKAVKEKNAKAKILSQGKAVHQQVQQIVQVKEKVKHISPKIKKAQMCVVGQNQLEQKKEKVPQQTQKKKMQIPKKGQQTKKKETTPPEKKRKKKPEKVQHQNKKPKNEVPEDKEKMKQQSLLLLKGHKQPQLKVHKLDPSKTQQQPQQPLPCPSQAPKPPQDPQMLPMKKQQKVKKSQQPKKKPSQKEPKPKTKRKQKQPISLLSPPPPPPSSTPIQVKPKTNRKRKASIAGATETALGSPPARRVLACADCGERFSEAFLLEEHIATVHALENRSGKSNLDGSVSGAITRAERETSHALSAESWTKNIPHQGQDVSHWCELGAEKTSTLPDRRDDALQSGEGGEMGLPVALNQTPKISGSMPGNPIHPDNFGMRVATDWDMEVEMGEIGLGDKVDRVSFPALNPSPSLPLATHCIEIEGKEGEAVSGDRIMESGTSVTPDLCASENEHSDGLKKQQKEEFNGIRKLPKDCAEDNSQEQVGGTITEDVLLDAVPKTLPSVRVFSPSLQATPVGSHNCDQSLQPSSTIQLQNFQLLEKAEDEGQIEGREFEEKYEGEGETACSLQLTTSVHEPQSGVTGEDIKEELLLEVDIVTVGDQNAEDSASSRDGTQTLDVLDAEKTQLSEEKSADSCTLPTKNQYLNPSVSIASTQADAHVSSCSGDCTEIKQEEEEIEVERRDCARRRLEKEIAGRSSKVRGRGRDQRGGRRRIGLDVTREVASEAATEGCQVIFQLQSLSDDSPIKDEEGADLLHHSGSPPLKVHLQQDDMGPRCPQAELLVGTGIPQSCLPASLEESSEEQIVFELESVITSVEVLKAEEMEVEGTGDQLSRPGDGQSPSILFERFLAGRQRDDGEGVECHNELQDDNGVQVNRTSLGFGLEMGPQSQVSRMALMGAVTGQAMKVEDLSPHLVPCQNGPSATPASGGGAIVGQAHPFEQQGGLQVFLVKEENPLVLDERQEFPGCGHTDVPDEEMRAEGTTCADSEAMLPEDREGGGDGDREGAISASPLSIDVGVRGGEQCIVFRVKEEEREVALDPPQREHGLSVLLVSGPAALDQQIDRGHTSANGPLASALHPGPYTDSGAIWVSVPRSCGAEEPVAENEECEQGSERLAQSGPQPDVFVCTGEDELTTEQQNREELLEFLRQKSDTELSDSSDSEPEEEAFAMACYHESSGSTRTDKQSSKKHDQSRLRIPSEERPGGLVTEENARGGREGVWTPVEYFSQYLDWKTWEDIAHSSATLSETPNSVTAKEVAQFVGIHIAMGTLKFPDKNLYWQDFTRVPLIADAMPAARFLWLARNLRLTRRSENVEAPRDADGGGHHEPRGEGVANLEGPGAPPRARRPDSEGTAMAANGDGLDLTHRSRKTDTEGHHNSPHNDLRFGTSEPSSDPLPAGLARMCANPPTDTARAEHTHNTRSRTQYAHRRSQEATPLEDRTHNVANALSNAQRPVEFTNSTTSFSRNTDPLWQVRRLLDRVRTGCQTLRREGHYGVDQHPVHLGQWRRKKSLKNPRPALQCTVLLGEGGLVLDFNLSTDDSGREDTLQRIIPRNKESGEAMVFLCKEELCTPAVLERLLVSGVKSAGRVGGVRGGVGDEFVSSDGKLTLLRCQQGFILSTLTERQAHQFSLIKDFKGAQRDSQLHKDLLTLYRTPRTASSPGRWPQSVLWHLTDLALVNSWLQYRRDGGGSPESLNLMAFRLEVAKALIRTSAASIPQSAPPHPPAPKLPSQDNAVSPAPLSTLPLPDATSRYDGLGHWPEQVADGEGARCRFGGCERTSRVRCLKCCVFLCISRNHNCFLKFHIQGST